MLEIIATGRFAIADCDVHLNADKSKVVPGDSPEAAYVYARKGHRIPIDQAIRYGLVNEDEMEKEAARKVKEAEARAAKALKAAEAAEAREAKAKEAAAKAAAKLKNKAAAKPKNK